MSIVHTLLMCTSCNKRGLTTGSNDSKVPMHHIRCSNCSNTWTVCLSCQVKLSSHKIWQKHESSNRHLKHSRPSALSKVDEGEKTAVPILEQTNTDGDQFWTLEDMCYSTGLDEGPSSDLRRPDQLFDKTDKQTLPTSPVVIKQETTFVHDWILSTQGPRSVEQVDKDSLISVFGKDSASPPFYHYESTNPGMGSHFLVASAFEISQPKSISVEEVKFCLNMTSLLSRLTGQERKQLANIMFDAVNANNTEKSIFKTIRLPTSTEDFNTIFVSGKHSILQNIPRPVVQTTPDKTHAYVSLIDVIANMMAANLPMDRFDDTTSSPMLTASHLTDEAKSALTLTAKIVTNQNSLVSK